MEVVQIPETLVHLPPKRWYIWSEIRTDIGWMAMNTLVVLFSSVLLGDPLAITVGFTTS